MSEGGAPRPERSEALQRLAGHRWALRGAVVGRERDWGTSGDHVSATLRYATVDGAHLDVTSTDAPAPSRDETEWRLLVQWLHETAGATKPPVFPLDLRADRWDQSLDVGGARVPFVFVGDEQRWCASGSVQGREVRLAGRAWPAESVRLVRLGDGRHA